jgi:hypothetical protein
MNEPVPESRKPTEPQMPIHLMEVAGIMNAKLRFHLPCNVSFDDCKITPVFGQKQQEDMVG